MAKPKNDAEDKPMTADWTKIRKAGYEAGYSGVSRQANPYDPKDESVAEVRKSWNDGWTEGNAKRREEVGTVKTSQRSAA